MPIKNGTVTCINHPDLPMVRNSRPTVLHPVDIVDGQLTAIASRGMFMSPYVCRECGYIEFYVLEKKLMPDTRT